MVKVRDMMKTPKFMAMMKTPPKPSSLLLHAHIKKGQGKCSITPKGKGPCHLHQLKDLKMARKIGAKVRKGRKAIKIHKIPNALT